MNEICRTCLSRDRRLTPITNSHRQILKWMNIKMKVEAVICWECEGYLLRLRRFRVQVMKAQRTMNLCHGRVRMISNMTSLSRLTERYSDTYDVTIDSDTDSVTKHTPDNENNCHDRTSDIENNCQNRTEQIDSTDTSHIKTENVSINENVNFNTVLIKSEPDSEDSETKSDSQNRTDSQARTRTDDIKTEDILTTSLEVEVKIESGSDNEMNENGYNDIDGNGNGYENDEEMEHILVQPEVVFFDEDKASQFTKENFYVVKTMSLDELEKARDADRNGARYKFCPFKCESCILGYYHEDLLNKHKAERHSESASHICTICSQHFFSKDNLDGHYKAHFNGYRCQICGYNHHRYSMMDVHYIKVHKNSVNRCSPCNSYFPNYRMLKYHRETTHRDLPTCAHCGKKYKTKAILKRHLVRHEATELLKCPVCHKLYRGAEGLRDHMRRHEARSHTQITDPYCADCDMTFKNIASYKNHLHFSLKHKGPEAMSRYTCSTCGKVFQNAPAVQRHMEAIHQQNTRCHICDKWFTREAKLKDHIKFVHEGAQKVKDKICTVCGVGFSENRILVGHMRTHTGEKPFSCARCPAAFSQSGTLKAHIKVKHEHQVIRKKRNRKSKK